MENIQLSKEQLDALLKNAISEYSKEVGMDNIDRKFGVFPNTTSEDYSKMDKATRLNKWIRAIVSNSPNDLAFVKAMSEGTASAGGFLVPVEFRQEIIRVAEQYGFARKYGNVFGTSLDTVNLVSEATLPTVAWTTEAAQITASDAAFAQPSIAVKKLAGITAMSRELFEDDKSNLQAYLASAFGEQIAYKEDEAALIGDGSSSYGSVTGLVNFASTNILDSGSSTTGAGVTADNLLDLAFQSGISDGERNGAVYIMHPTVLSYIRKLKGSGSGEYLVQGSLVNGLPSIWGYPVVTSPVMGIGASANDKFVVFTNPKRHLHFADREQVQISVGREGTVNSINLFEKDSLAIRVTERVGMACAIEGGVAVLKV